MCAVENDSTNANFGLITFGSAVKAGDICTVTISASTTVNGYTPYTASIPLTLRKPNPVQIVTGSAYSCVIFQGGGVKCWGQNNYGQLGVGDSINRGNSLNQMGSNLPFVNLGAGKGAKSMAAGSSHTCAILNDDSLKCWGWGAWGQVGDGNVNNPTTPVSVNLGTDGDNNPYTVKAVAAGYIHTCAIRNDGLVMCWGSDTYGEGGYDDIWARNFPTRGTVNLGTGRTATAIALGDRHSCALLDNGSVVCWGRADQGALGVGDSGHSNCGTEQNQRPCRAAPTAVNLGSYTSGENTLNHTATAIAAGNAHTCAILNDASVKCWGNNGSGRLGVGDSTTRHVPTAVDFGNDGAESNPQTYTAASLFLGKDHSCAIRTDNVLVCWGEAGRGALGYENSTDLNTPPTTRVLMQGHYFGDFWTSTAVGAGDDHTCAILDNNAVQCWGNNAHSQLGQGDFTSSWGTTAFDNENDREVRLFDR